MNNIILIKKINCRERSERRRRLKIIIGNIIVFLAIINYCNAGDTDVFGIDPKSVSMGRANSFVGGGPYAAKSNPAGLVNDTSKAQIAISFLDSFYNLKDANKGRKTNNESGIKSDPYDASAASNSKNASLGLNIPIGNKLALGISALSPIDSFASVHAFTGNEVYYLHYDDRSQRPEIYTAIGAKLPHNFSLGAGVFYSIKVDGNVQLAISDNDADTRMLMQLKPVYIPYGQIQYDNDDYYLSLFYRVKQKTNAKISFDVNFDVGLGTIPFSGASSLVAYYDPAILAIGAGVDKETFAIYSSVKMSYWSKYKAPIIQLSGKDLDSLTNTYTYEEVSLQNSWSLFLGGELKKVLSFEKINVDFRSGIEWHESAIGDDYKTLAIVDTDRLVLALGSGINFDGFSQYIRKPFGIDFALQFSMLKNKTLDLFRDGVVVQRTSVGKNILTLATGVHFDF